MNGDKHVTLTRDTRVPIGLALATLGIMTWGAVELAMMRSAVQKLERQSQDYWTVTQQRYYAAMFRAQNEHLKLIVPPVDPPR